MSGMRVIGGKAGGRKLRPVPGSTTRPITDRVKENLFNILGADVQSATFLDLFAGTGSVGIEALSRGAAYVRFLDADRQAVNTVRANLESTGLAEHTDVIRMDSFSFLERPPDRRFDYVYIAPPQYRVMWKRALLGLEANPGWLSEDGWVIVQIHPREYEALELQRLVEFDRRKYGSTLLVFFQTGGSEG
jgi:16S rRNA (guanine966-N2)-methyltransferase